MKSAAAITFGSPVPSGSIASRVTSTSSVSVLTVKAGMRLDDDVGDEEDEEGEREQDRRDAVGAEARLGAVALADAGARGVAADVDRARGEPVGGDVSHTVPGTFARP